MSRRSLRRALHHKTAAAVLAVAVAAGCGKKGPPLPPLVRIPEAVAVAGTRRSGSDAYITLRIPAKNLDGSTPVDFAAVELVALTADRPPSRAVFLERGTTVASIAVAMPPATTDDSRPPAVPAPGPSPGDVVTVLETLTEAMFVPVALPAMTAESSRPAVPASREVVPAPPGATAPQTSQPSQESAPAAPEIRRYYMAFTRDARKRPGPSGTVASVSLASLPDAPGDLRVTYTEQTTTVAWSAVAGATGYNVYAEASADSPSPPVPAQGVTRVPLSLNGALLEKTTYSEPVRFGEMACYRVRAVRGAASDLSEGPSSPPVCERPGDSFPPAAPGDIRVVPSSGEITVEWMPSSDADLAGYLVLRGTAGDDTLQPIIDAPTKGTQYVDRNVTAGVRYAYAVVAVDTAGNRSAASMRDEATAR